VTLGELGGLISVATRGKTIPQQWLPVSLSALFGWSFIVGTSQSRPFAWKAPTHCPAPAELQMIHRGLEESIAGCCSRWLCPHFGSPHVYRGTHLSRHNVVMEPRQLAIVRIELCRDEGLGKVYLEPLTGTVTQAELDALIESGDVPTLVCARARTRHVAWHVTLIRSYTGLANGAVRCTRGGRTSTGQALP
jgi:hypothetical protein